jgi:hypothetical protein
MQRSRSIPARPRAPQANDDSGPPGRASHYVRPIRPPTISQSESSRRSPPRFSWTLPPAATGSSAGPLFALARGDIVPSPKRLTARRWRWVESVTPLRGATSPVLTRPIHQPRGLRARPHFVTRLTTPTALPRRARAILAPPLCGRAGPRETPMHQHAREPAPWSRAQSPRQSQYRTEHCSRWSSLSPALACESRPTTEC